MRWRGRGWAGGCSGRGVTLRRHEHFTLSQSHSMGWLSPAAPSDVCTNVVSSRLSALLARASRPETGRQSDFGASRSHVRVGSPPARPRWRDDRGMRSPSTVRSSEWCSRGPEPPACCRKALACCAEGVTASGGSLQSHTCDARSRRERRPHAGGAGARGSARHALRQLHLVDPQSHGSWAALLAEERAHDSSIVTETPTPVPSARSSPPSSSASRSARATIPLIPKIGKCP